MRLVVMIRVIQDSDLRLRQVVEYKKDHEYNYHQKKETLPYEGFFFYLHPDF